MCIMQLCKLQNAKGNDFATSTPNSKHCVPKMYVCGDIDNITNHAVIIFASYHCTHLTVCRLFFFLSTSLADMNRRDGSSSPLRPSVRRFTQVYRRTAWVHRLCVFVSLIPMLCVLWTGQVSHMLHACMHACPRQK